MKKNAMKNITLFLACVTFAACASSRPDNVFKCGPGQDVEIRFGLEGTRNRQAVETGDNISFLVEVANNSHQEIMVESIRVDPDPSGHSATQLEAVSRSVHQEIEAGKDHVFEFPSRVIAGAVEAQFQRSSPMSTPSQVIVTVVLGNGDAYRCPFSASTN